MELTTSMNSNMEKLKGTKASNSELKLYSNKKQTTK